MSPVVKRLAQCLINISDIFLNSVLEVDTNLIMEGVIRESALGQALRFITGNRVLRYVEETQEYNYPRCFIQHTHFLFFKKTTKTLQRFRISQDRYIVYGLIPCRRAIILGIGAKEESGPNDHVTLVPWSCGPIYRRG